MSSWMEAMRMLGECWLLERQPAAAEGVWEEALAFAETLSPEARRTTSYAAVGEALADLRRSSGRLAEALAAERRVARLAGKVEEGPA
jgi:hypothetical protein